MVDDEFASIIAAALAEDIGFGDITSHLLVPDGTQAEMRFVAREAMVACGTFILGMVYAQLGGVTTVPCVAEGQGVAAGDVLAKARGDARALLAGERVALNLMQRACGVATLTAAYVKAVKGTEAIILDTRKTMPGLRSLDKYAVRAGGGQNHRMGLYDMVLIKDNHIALAGGVAQAIKLAREGTELPVVVECDTLEQAQEAIQLRPDRILLDNMTNEMLSQAVAFGAKRVPFEASGGVSLETVRAIAETGVDYISVGKLTHSAPSMDIGADIVIHTDATQ